MLSFEEFFIKKKIDLFALKSANQELYHEFEAHYHAMGEKSFDHSKKFWFNKLRKSYLLIEETPSPEVSSTKESTPSPTAKTIETTTKLGFKPKFRAKPTVASNPLESEQQAPHPAPSGFKPRFKAGATKATPSEETKPEAIAKEETATVPSSEKKEEIKEVSSKPAGFKPRFKAGLTKNTPPTDQKEQ